MRSGQDLKIGLNASKIHLPTGHLKLGVEDVSTDTVLFSSSILRFEPWLDLFFCHATFNISNFML